MLKTILNSLEQSGVVGIVILIVASIGFLLAFNRLIYLFQLKKRFKDTEDHEHVIAQLDQCYQQHKTLPLDKLQLKLEGVAQQHIPNLNYGLDFLKLLISIAPMLGLLGTVSGMIITFQTMAINGSSDPALLAGGISMALITTVLGLTTAIPLLILHKIAQNKSLEIIHELELVIISLLTKH